MFLASLLMPCPSKLKGIDDTRNKSSIIRLALFDITLGYTKIFRKESVEKLTLLMILKFYKRI